jgi:23S rRNA (cytosine1962-C5)-methyltransferase
MGYALIDSGHQSKLERFGPYLLIRPCLQAVWKPNLQQEYWDQADAVYLRDPLNRWEFKKTLSTPWIIDWKGLKFMLNLTESGQVGIFPEHAHQWSWIESNIDLPCRILNLFAYTGGVSLVAARAGGSVCHLDASKPVVMLARENAVLNQLDQKPIRWIVEDVLKFVRRELKRNSRYDAIILDPPSFGRGSQGEVFKIERDLPHLLQECVKILSPHPQFMLLSCHTPGYTPHFLEKMLFHAMKPFSGKVEAGDLKVEQHEKLSFGTYARWSC